MNIVKSIPVFLSSIALAVSMSGFLALRSENTRLEEELTTVKNALNTETGQRKMAVQHLQKLILFYSPEEREQLAKVISQ